MTGAPELSVVIPAYNAESSIGDTLDALVVALDRAGLAAEILIVDDGSTDETADRARRHLEGRALSTVIGEENRGRLEARRAGVEAATSDWVLLLDSRVQLRPDALAFVMANRREGARIWTSHVHVLGSSPLAVFWSLLAELAWADYFDHPRTVAYGAEEFDRYPKGTTCFLAPRSVLLAAMAAFRSAYADPRDANDDTPVIRWMAEREPIHVSPEFACDYAPRTDLPAFVRHSTHRGVVFLDGHGRRGSRFRPVVIAFYPVSAAITCWAALRPRRWVGIWAVLSAAMTAVGISKARSAAEVRALALVGPLYAVAHGVGMWRGAALVLRRLVSRT